MAKKPIIRYFDRGVWYDATVSDIGNLEDLNTVHKTTVVEAINDIIGGNINISGELLEKLTALDNNISRIDGLIASDSLNETQANQMNQFVTNKLNELNQSMEELNKQRDQRLKEQEEKVAQLKLDSESDKKRIEEITLDLNTTKEKLNNAELNVTSVTQLVDEINGKISQAVSKTDFDLLEGTVREQKTLIDQTAEGIKLLATKEELDKSNENVKSIKSALDIQAGLIESKVSSEQLINEMEKIDKYMPNLLRYTRNWQNWENDDEANIDVTLNEYRDCIIQRTRGIGKGLSTTVEDLEIGETYSLSVWVKHDDINAKLYAMVDNVEIIMTDLNSEETFVGNDFKRMRCSFVSQDTTAKVRFIFKDCRTDSYGYLAGAKCEKNKKVSGWQPNSEDVYQSIKSARSEIKQTDNKITTLVETVNKQGDLITSHKTSIDETDKAIKLQAESIKTLGESIEKTQADLKVASDKITSKVWKADVGEMISDINIDNKNRVLNSDFGDGWKLWSETNNLFQLKQIGNYKFAVAERSGLSQNMAIAIATNKFPVKHNERLMFGFYFYCANLSKLDNKIVGALELLDINDVRIDRVDFDVSKLSLENGSFTKLTDTYFVEDERIVKARLRFFLNRNGNVGFALPMVQGGDIKSSDWSLAPEDVARRFNDTNVTISNYEQTVNGFKQTVESYKGSVDGYSNQVSEFNQTVNGFSQNIKEYKESNDKRVQQLESSLTTEAGKIEAVVKESAGTKDELGKLTADGGRISQLELTAQGFSTTVGDITKKVNNTNDRIDNISVGGRNLARGTYGEYTEKETVNVTVDSNLCVFNNKTYLDGLKVGDTVSYRCILRYTDIVVEDVKYHTNKGRVFCQGYGNVTGWASGTFDNRPTYEKTIEISGSGEVELKGQFTVTADMLKNQYWNTQIRIDYVRSGKIERKCFKVEKGNVYTDWSPAPEDQQSQIDNINNNLREQYMTIEQSNSWIDQKKDSIVQGVSSSVQTLGTRLDNLQVGGRNLYVQSATNTFVGDISSSSTTIKISEKYGFKSEYKTSAKNYSAVRLQQLQFNGKRYAVVSFNAYVNTGTLDVKVDICDFGNKHFAISTTNNRYSLFVDNINKYNTADTYNGFLDFEFILAQGQTLYVEYIMVEYATTPSNHSPAPEDQQSQIDGINNNLTKNYYTKTDVDAQISTSKEGIVLDYKKEVQSIGMGGTNLARNTGSSWVMGYGIPNTRYYINSGRTTLYYDSSTNRSQSAEILPQGDGFYITPVNGNTYTQSLYIETNATYNEKETFNFTWFTAEGGHNYQKGHIVKVGGNTYRIWSTFKWDRSNNRLRLFDITDLYKVLQYRTSGNYISFLNPKVEIGYSPTAWSPSPEDTQSQIDGVNNNLRDNYYNKTTVDSMLKVDGQGITTYVKSTQSQLDNLQVGGRNLAQGTSNEYSSKYSSFSGTTNTCPYLAKVLTDGLSVGDTVTVRLLYKYTDIVATSGQTAKCWIQGSGSSTAWNSGAFYSSSVKTLAGSGEFEFLYSFKITAEHLKNTYWGTNIRHDYIQSGSVQWKMFKVEKGNKATDWSPAPEDYNDKIDGVSGNLDDLDKKIGNIDTWKTEVAESFIEQTANSLSALIKDKNGSSLMSFDSTSATWSFNTSVLENNISDAKDAGDKAQKTANEANSLAKDLKNLLNDIQNKTAYITMTTYNGQPCIELGKTDNNFKVRITNTSVDFLDGSTRVAYVSNNQLYIDKAVVKNEFQIGEGTGFVWKKRSNGNMGLRWGGVTTVQTKYRYPQSSIDMYSANGYVGWWEIYEATDKFTVGDEVAFEIFHTDKNKYVYLHALVVDKDATRLKTTSINVVDY